MSDGEQQFPNEQTRHLINMALRAAITVIVAIAAWQFKQMNDELKLLAHELQETKVALATAAVSNFTQKDWQVQKEQLDKRSTEQARALLELQGKVNAIDNK
jgi:hypothetical protein